MKYIQPFMQIVGYQGDVDKVSAFYTKYLAQPWHTMFKVFNRCLTSRTSGHDQTQINILQIFHTVVNHVHVDYASLLWTPSAHKTPTSTTIVGDVQKKRKRRQSVGETSSPKPSLNISVKQFKSSDTPIPPPSDDKEREEESYASKFVDSVFHDDDDSGNRIEPESNKENPKTVDDDDDDENEKEKQDDYNDDYVNDDHTDHTLDGTQETRSLDTSNEKMYTPIPSPHRSPRINLSLDKTIAKELTDTISPSTATTSQGQRKTRHISSKYTHIPQALRRICKSQDIMIKQMEKKFIASNATNDIIENNFPKVLVEAIMKERDTFQETIKRSLQDQANDPELWEVLKQKFEKSSVSSGPCRTYTFCSTDHDDHQEDDSPLEREKRAKRQKTSKSSKSARETSSKQSVQRSETYIIPEDYSPELIEEFQNVDKHVPTVYDHERMEATLRDMMSNQFRNAEEYAYHLELSMNYMENQINGNTEEKSYILSLHKIHDVPFPEDDLEEKMKRWVKK
ncbi:hypothetical protein Tco_0519226 [Tanacetum coccineum]